MQVQIERDDALIIVDVQNDFLPGGSLAVAQGDRVFEPINRLAPHFNLVFATRCWHPPEHRFFEAHGGPWPYHCIAGTPGAEFSPKLDTAFVHSVINKGTDPDTDGYSGFAGTKLAELLHEAEVRRVFVCGLATDYCVKATALEAMENGFEVIVITDAIAAVNVHDGDEEKALATMREAGARLVLSADVREGAPSR